MIGAEAARVAEETAVEVMDKEEATIGITIVVDKVVVAEEITEVVEAADQTGISKSVFKLSSSNISKASNWFGAFLFLLISLKR